eukprot:13748116-Alexandrium_andersonii.AAC.1
MLASSTSRERPLLFLRATVARPAPPPPCASAARWARKAASLELPWQGSAKAPRRPPPEERP